MVTEQTIYHILFEAVKQRSRVHTLDSVHVSEVVGCLRRSYYQRVKPFTATPRVAIILLGSAIHEAIQDVLRRYGYYVEYAVALNLESFKLVGTIDAYHPDEEAVLELKTSDGIPQEPYETHVRQVSIYSLMVGARQSFVVYISRSDGRVKVFEVKPDKSALKWAVERARLLRACVIARQPPPKERTSLCNYCEYSLLVCNGGGEGSG